MNQDILQALVPLTPSLSDVCVSGTVERRGLSVDMKGLTFNIRPFLNLNTAWITNAHREGSAEKLVSVDAERDQTSYFRRC